MFEDGWESQPLRSPWRWWLPLVPELKGCRANQVRAALGVHRVRLAPGVRPAQPAARASKVPRVRPAPRARQAPRVRPAQPAPRVGRVPKVNRAPRAGHWGLKVL